MQYAIMPTPATVGLTIAVVFTAFLGAISGDVDATAMIIAPYVTAEFTCTGPYNEFPPKWLLDGKGQLDVGKCYNSNKTNTRNGNATATLIIHGNSTQCETFNISCRIYKDSQFLYLHNTTVEIEGRLSSPESVRHVNSTTIEWNPPYRSVNNDVIHVYPHIIQYTAYSTDIDTGNIIFKENVTGTQFTSNTRGDTSCPMYQISAWNAGGEGEKSEPVQESIPQVPRNVTAAAEVTVDSVVVHIRIDNVDVVCTSRMPEFFVITVLTLAASVLNETTRQHQPGQEVANFTINVPQTVDVCSLHVRISAGNSAGISTPSEAVEVDCSGDSTDSTTTGSTESGDNQLPEVLVAVAVLCAVGIVAAAVVTTCYKVYRIYKRRNRKENTLGQSDNHNSESSSLGGPVPLHQPPVTEVIYVASQQNTGTSRPAARDPEGTAVWIDSAPSTGSSTESGHSADHLLPQ